jgi:hypothetical protein
MEMRISDFFKFWYEKFLMRFSFIFAFLSFLGVFVYAYYTEISVRLPGERAPFSETLSLNPTTGSLDEQQSLPLDKAHRSNRELQAWLNTVVSESLFFHLDNYEEIQKTIRPYFTDTGYAQYQDYLTRAEILKSLRQNNYRLSVFVEAQPLLLRDMPLKGVYRWLYQVPITISYFPKDNNSLLKNSSNMVNKKLSLTVQLARVKLPDDPDAVQIESWNVKGRR